MNISYKKSCSDCFINGIHSIWQSIYIENKTIVSANIILSNFIPFSILSSDIHIVRVWANVHIWWDDLGLAKFFTLWKTKTVLFWIDYEKAMNTRLQFVFENKTGKYRDAPLSWAAFTDRSILKIRKNK